MVIEYVQYILFFFFFFFVRGNQNLSPPYLFIKIVKISAQDWGKTGQGGQEIFAILSSDLG